MLLTFSECVYWSQLYLKRKFSPLTSNLAITGNYLFLRTILLRVISVSWPYLLVPCWKLFRNFLLQCNMGKTRLNFLKHMIQKTKIPFDFYLKYSCLLGLTTGIRICSKWRLRIRAVPNNHLNVFQQRASLLPLTRKGEPHSHLPLDMSPTCSMFWSPLCISNLVCHNNEELCRSPCRHRIFCLRRV